MNNIHPIADKTISRTEKEVRLGQRAKVFWFTGLSGSGKSTLAIALERKLFDLGYQGVILDGDTIRTGINNNLSFSADDRQENIRRVAEVAKLFFENGMICIVSFITPMRAMRDMARAIIGPENFVEVFIDTPLAICEARDVKGLYQKARAGQISDFTGVSAPYELPEHPEIHIQTAGQEVDQSLAILFEEVMTRIRWQ